MSECKREIVADPVTEQPVVVWGGLEAVPVQNQDLEGVGYLPHGETATVILEGRQLVLREERDPLSAAYTCVLRIPVALGPGRRLIGYLATLRGYASSSEGARIGFVADIAGETRTYQHAYDEVADGPFNWAVFSNGCAPQWDTDPELLASEDGPVNVGPPNLDSDQLFPLTINLAVFATRRSPADFAEAEITSIDIRLLNDQIPQ